MPYQITSHQFIIATPKINPILILIFLLPSPPHLTPCTTLYTSLSPPSTVRRAPLLRLEFTCLTRGDLSAVKAYFEKFANFNFPRQQIHYPRCYGLWLKEISAQKVRKKNIVLYCFFSIFYSSLLH